MASTEADEDERLNSELWSARLEYEDSRDNPYCNGKVYLIDNYEKTKNNLNKLIR